MPIVRSLRRELGGDLAEDLDLVGRLAVVDQHGDDIRHVREHELRATLLRLKLDGAQVVAGPVQEEMLELEVDRLAGAQEEVGRPGAES